MEKCNKCNGTGTRDMHGIDMSNKPPNKLPCVYCRGTGYKLICEKCGKVTSMKPLKVHKRNKDFQIIPGEFKEIIRCEDCIKEGLKKICEAIMKG